jgi:hypothetical protein
MKSPLGSCGRNTWGQILVMCQPGVMLQCFMCVCAVVVKRCTCCMICSQFDEVTTWFLSMWYMGSRCMWTKVTMYACMPVHAWRVCANAGVVKGCFETCDISFVSVYAGLQWSETVFTYSTTCCHTFGTYPKVLGVPQLKQDGGMGATLKFKVHRN